MLILSPAATTAAACIRPGDLVRRSIGPDTETAASIRPAGPRTGADTDATPGSRSAAVAAQPRLRTWASVVAVKLGAAQPAVHPAAFFPGQQDLRGRASRHRQRRADRDGVPQAARPSAAATPIRCPRAPGTAGRSPGGVPELGETGCAMASSRSSPAAAASSPILGPSTNRPCASRVSIRWLARATAIRCAVGRARPRRLDQLRERGRAVLQRRQNGNRLVEDADSARVVHVVNTAVSECETQTGRERA